MRNDMCGNCMQPPKDPVYEYSPQDVANEYGREYPFWPKDPYWPHSQNKADGAELYLHQFYGYKEQEMKEEKSMTRDQMIARIQQFSDYLWKYYQNFQDDQETFDKSDYSEKELEIFKEKNRHLESMINEILDDYNSLFEGIVSDRVM